MNVNAAKQLYIESQHQRTAYIDDDPAFKAVISKLKLRIEKGDKTVTFDEQELTAPFINRLGDLGYSVTYHSQTSLYAISGW